VSHDLSTVVTETRREFRREGGDDIVGNQFRGRNDTILKEVK